MGGLIELYLIRLSFRFEEQKTEAPKAMEILFGESAKRIEALERERTVEGLMDKLMERSRSQLSLVGSVRI